MSKYPHPTRRQVLRHGLTGMGVLMTGPCIWSCRSAAGPAGDMGPDAEPTDVGGADRLAGDADLLDAALDPDGSDLADRLAGNIANVGPLGDPDANGLRLPSGFSSRIVARSREAPVAGSDFVWHDAPDGGAAFPTDDGGWIYVSNSEIFLGGGASALRFDSEGTVVDAYRILDGTGLNCAGGPTPWGTWLSCEERPTGRVWECDPTGREAAVAHDAMGMFVHEAAAVDLGAGHVYLTEDLPDGRLYRFTAEAPAVDGRLDLSRGHLEAARAASDDGGAVDWLEVPDPLATDLETRNQVPESTWFNGGEGIWFHAGTVYFTTKGDNRLWAYDVTRHELEIVYDQATAETPLLTGVDNVVVSAHGEVLVAEDAGDMQIVAVLPGPVLVPLVQIPDHVDSEVTGPAFDPSGTRLYFSSQRGADNFARSGITYEVTGPFVV